MAIPKLTEAVIRAGTNPESFVRGQSYCKDGAISNAGFQGHVLTGLCEGNSAPHYRVRV